MVIRRTKTRGAAERLPPPVGEGWGGVSSGTLGGAWASAAVVIKDDRESYAAFFKAKVLRQGAPYVGMFYIHLSAQGVCK